MSDQTIKKYRLLDSIILGFIGPREQIDVVINPKEGVTVECDGSTIWLVNRVGRHESTTTANFMQVNADLFEEIIED